MRILFDQGTPVPLRKELKGHRVETAYERGWSTLENGELMAAAEADDYDLLITTDTNLKYQQNLANRTIAVLVLSTPSWPRISRCVPAIEAAISSTAAGSYMDVEVP